MVPENPAEFIRDTTPDLPPQRYDLQILRSLRRMFRAADLFSHRLQRQHRVTGPQLMCLHTLLESDGLTVSELSLAIFLSASTVVGILDRLERQGLVTRVRSTKDRRKVLIHVTQTGRELVLDAPLPLQRALELGLRQLEKGRQRELAEALNSLVEMLEITDLEAAPLLETGALTLDANGTADASAWLTETEAQETQAE
jgi:DNA-binding MarR family transcriptional regulator